MVFYYSATGNCFWIAREIATRQGEQLVSVTDALKAGSDCRYDLPAGEPVGFVFPVHAWNPPDTLLAFIRKLDIAQVESRYIYAVATCGDSSGNTMPVFEKALRQKGMVLRGKWEIRMPNNYLPLQDVDDPTLEKEKLDNAARLLQGVNRDIAARSPQSGLMEDAFPAFKTGFIGFFFRTFGKSSRPFYVTEACTGCGVCQRICLKNTIDMQGNRPRWGKHCDQCYACINRCPQKAIQYGKKTETRGRYCHPALKAGVKPAKNPAG